MPLVFWLFWTTLVITNASNQAKQDAIQDDFSHFKNVPHKYKIKDIGDK